MLVVVAAFRGYAIVASDGRMGTVSDCLYDDRSWKIRWLVVDTGSWLTGRKVLVHPSAVAKPDYEHHELAVALTRAQVEESPDIRSDQPVSREAELNLKDYYGWDPLWGGGDYFGGGFGIGAGGIGKPLSTPPFFAAASHDTDEVEASLADNEADPHLRSTTEIIGYHVHATDGSIGHMENLLIDDTSWSIRYFILDTKNWWIGRHVLISPYAVTKTSWEDHDIHLNVTREKVKSSPAWDPLAMVDQVYEKELHHYYNWPGYGFH
jgi:hypothetical protein